MDKNMNMRSPIVPPPADIARLFNELSFHDNKHFHFKLNQVLLILIFRSIDSWSFGLTGKQVIN